MSATLLQFDPAMVRRYLIACERERLAHKEITPVEMARLVIATRGERMNYELLGRVLAFKHRERNEFSVSSCTADAGRS